MNENVFSVLDKVCFVTGASTGLGAHIARMLLDNGAYVVGVSRSQPDWDVGPFGDKFQFRNCDVRDEQEMIAIFEQTQSSFGAVEVLVNNAGISRVEKSANYTTAGLSEIFGVNVIAAGLVAGTAAKQMRNSKKGGSIINVTSVMADSSVAGLSAYSATKAALAQLTSGMASEWARYGIRVNNLQPGWFPTGMTNSYIEQGLGHMLKARIPMQRLGDASELDGAVLLLASDASRYMTGSTLTVDGGFSLIN